MHVKAGDGVAAIELGDTLVIMWKKPATLERWKWQQALHESMIARNSNGIVCLDLILEGSNPPDSNVRATMQADFRRVGESLRRLVVVPLGDSMWLSVVRTIVRAVLLVSGQSKRQVVVRSVFEGIDKVREVAGVATPSPADLDSAVQALCRQLAVDPKLSVPPSTPRA
jgi:hypothetical protein